jgi:hypothetical protein
MEAGLDGPDWDVEAARDLVDREVAVEAEGDHDPVLRRKRQQRRTQDVPVVCLPVRVTGRDGDLVLDVLCLPARRSLKPVAAGVDQDSVEPGFEARFVTERGPLAPGLDVRVVGGVLRLDWVAQDRAGKAVRPVEMALRQARECRLPAISLLSCDGAAFCHGYLDRLAHDDMTNERCETFIRPRFAGSQLAAVPSTGGP